WRVACEAVTGGVRWRVAAEVLAEATFPVVLDPLIGPEILVVDPILGTAQLLQNNPSVAASPNGYLVAWTDTREYRNELHAARISTAGVLLDPAGIYLAPGGPNGGTRVVSNGTDYLVVWHGAGIVGVRVSAAGVALDATPIVISAPAGPLPI